MVEETRERAIDMRAVPGAGPQIVAIPFPLPGHIRPMLQLCKVLMDMSACTIVFVNTHRNTPHLEKILDDPQLQPDASASPSAPPPVSGTVQLWNGRMSLVSVPDGLTDSTGSWDYVRGLLHAFAEALPHAVNEQLEKLRSMDNRRVACVLVDVYLGWAQDIADRLHAPRVALWTSLAAELQVYLHASQLMSDGTLPFRVPSGRSLSPQDFDYLIPGRTTQEKRPMYHRVPDDHSDTVHIPGLGNLDRKDFPSFLQIEDSSDIIFRFYVDQVSRCSEAFLVLINTIQDLEAPVMNAIKAQIIDAHAVGPLFMLAKTGGKTGPTTTNDCFQWLDTQKYQSVMYVAFGTMGLSPLELKELIAGLEASNQAYLLACSNVTTDSKDFELSSRGLLLDWVPQAQVLQHPSIGGFLSHCGWNSTLESLSAGVPILGCPVATDQVLTSKLIVHPWQVGLKLARPTEREALFDATRVASSTRELIAGRRGEALRAQAQKWKATARSLVGDGGLYGALGSLLVEKLEGQTTL